MKKVKEEKKIHLLILKNFHIVDESTDVMGTVAVRDGRIDEVITHGREILDADWVIDGKGRTLMPAFIDLHAHFRDPGFPEKETLESACLAAVAGGYGTAVCMANTKPVIDTYEAALEIKSRSDVFGLIDLYPAMALTKDMGGRELSDIKRVSVPHVPLVLVSEDGKDVYNDGLFLTALKEAKRIGTPVSCHCDAGGIEVEEAKKAGMSPEQWSRIEENNATKRAITLGTEADCRLHIAHVSTKEAVNLVREAKSHGVSLTCEATPHHIALTEETAALLGKGSFGRVNPPLRTKADRLALIAALADGTIDAIATDHAPHTQADKAHGAPGFTGFETGFAVCYTELVKNFSNDSDNFGNFDLRKLSMRMSATPSRILGLHDRGRIAKSLRADLVVVDTEASWTVKPDLFKSKGKNSPFTGRTLFGKVLMTIHNGRVVMQQYGF